MFNYDKFSQNIRKNRKYLGYTLEKFSEKVDLDSKFLGRIELGHKKPSTATIIKILNALNTDFENFYKENLSIETLKIKEIIDIIRSIEINKSDEKFLLDVLISINNMR